MTCVVCGKKFEIGNRTKRLTSAYCSSSCQGHDKARRDKAIADSGCITFAALSRQTGVPNRTLRKWVAKHRPAFAMDEVFGVQVFTDPADAIATIRAMRSAIVTRTDTAGDPDVRHERPTTRPQAGVPDQLKRLAQLSNLMARSNDTMAERLATAEEGEAGNAMLHWAADLHQMFADIHEALARDIRSGAAESAKTQSESAEPATPRPEMMAAEELRAVLDENGVKPSELAERLNVHPANVYHWRAGRHPIPRKYVPRIKDVIQNGLARQAMLLPPSVTPMPSDTGMKWDGSSRGLNNILRITGLTQAELARRLGVSGSLVSSWVRGNARVTDARLKQINHVMRNWNCTEVSSDTAQPANY